MWFGCTMCLFSTRLTAISVALASASAQETDVRGIEMLDENKRHAASAGS